MAVAATDVATSGAASPSLPCKNAGRLIRATQNVVLTIRNGDGYYACYKGHSARSIGLDDGSETFGAIGQVPAISGRYVAAGSLTVAQEACYGFVASTDLVSGKRKQTNLHDCARSIIDVEITSNGTVAWSAKLKDGTGEIHVLTRTAPDQTIDSGPGLDPKSLSVTTHHAYWLKDTIANSRPL